MEQTPAQRARQTTKDLRAARKALHELTEAVSLACARLDAAMQTPASRQRGAHVAAILALLDLANDCALHDALKQSFPAIANAKQRLAAAVAARGLPTPEEILACLKT